MINTEIDVNEIIRSLNKEIKAYKLESEKVNKVLEDVKKENVICKEKLKKYVKQNENLQNVISKYEASFMEKNVEVLKEGEKMAGVYDLEKIELQFEHISEKFLTVLDNIKVHQNTLIEDNNRLKELIVFILQCFHENQHSELKYIIKYTTENDTFIDKEKFKPGNTLEKDELKVIESYITSYSTSEVNNESDQIQYSPISPVRKTSSSKSLKQRTAESNQLSPRKQNSEKKSYIKTPKKASTTTNVHIDRSAERSYSQTVSNYLKFR